MISQSLWRYFAKTTWQQLPFCQVLQSCVLTIYVLCWSVLNMSVIFLTKFYI